MSEEILKALVQLYAIITKQDGVVTEKEREFVVNSFKRKLSTLLVKKYILLYEEYINASLVIGQEEGGKNTYTVVEDSVKTLEICKKINATLTAKQKIVVLIELLELVKSYGDNTSQGGQIIDIISSAFNIPQEEYQLIESFVFKTTPEELNYDNIIFSGVDVCDKDIDWRLKRVDVGITEGAVFFLKLKRTDLIFVKYYGEDEAILNNFLLSPNLVTLFSQGSTLRLAKGGFFYFSDVQSFFFDKEKINEFTFSVKGVWYKFPNGTVGLRDIDIFEESGKLVGIMGASGSGKTTLLNIMAGLEVPSKGHVFLNGLDVHENIEQTREKMGYISQDDLLIEELSVFENLFFNAQLCFKDKSKNEITLLVDKVLSDLGLLDIEYLQVGSPLNKKISGGQRKRLNIALELIREPSILFVDEPTSGLSSRDSENVMDLLKELSRKGTLIFVIIHQPSSDIYKIFDKMFILDMGGYLIYNGTPVEAVTYFKRLSNHINADSGQCEKCGNINPEQIFNIIEEKVVDDYGNYTSIRKINPIEWYNHATIHCKPSFKKEVLNAPIRFLSPPSNFKQFLIFIYRDIKTKLSNTQYLAVNIFEAPLLAIILSLVVRYNNSNASYIYRFNDNIPAFILMSIVVSLFIGLSLSADELIKDRKIIKRESFLNLSRFSYLISKISILFVFSSFQMLVYVIIANYILEIKDMTFVYWLVLFSCACLANLLGMLISSLFQSATTVYIFIPLLLIPQIILSGAMFSFDKINDGLKHDYKVPLIADLMASRWAYEALAVYQFKDNKYQREFYPLEQVEAISHFNQVYLLPELRAKLKRIEESWYINKKLTSSILVDLKLIYRELEMRKNILNKSLPSWENLVRNFSAQTILDLNTQFDELDAFYIKVYTSAAKKKENILVKEELNENSKINFTLLKDKYYNESLSDIVKNVNSSTKFIVSGDNLISKTNSVFFIPDYNNGLLDYRAHFFSPVKRIMGKNIETLYFNIAFIWLLTLVMFILLYSDVLNKLLKVRWLNTYSFTKKRRYAKKFN